MRRVLETLVRLAGAVVLGCGLTLGALVLSEAWYLYRAPGRIAAFAAEVEVASGVDRALNSVLGGQVDPGSGAQYSLSYYFSWVLSLLLLSLLTRMAFGCIREGAHILLAGLRDPAAPPPSAAERQTVPASASAAARPAQEQVRAEEPEQAPKTVIPRFRPARPRPVPPVQVAELHPGQRRSS